MSTKALILRADASVAMGTGHVMRCLALAQAWQDAGGRSIFAMTLAQLSLSDRLLAENMEVSELAAEPGTEADVRSLVDLTKKNGGTWVVVDGYHFGAAYQNRLKEAGLRVLFIDDNGKAGHYSADIVLNQNAHAEPSMYIDREPYTRLLLGPRYAMLRREFAQWHEWKRDIAQVGSKVLVTMGGSDPDNVTARVVKALQLVQLKQLEAVVVVGGSNPHLESLKQLVGQCQHGVRLEIDVSNMAELMAWGDVAVSAAGTTCWEMCLLGLPAILMDLADNQQATAAVLEQRGIAVYLGGRSGVTPAIIAASLESILLSAETRASMSHLALGLVDVRGTARIVSAIGTGSLHLRSAEPRDSRLLWEWVNDPDVRAASFSSLPIPWNQHAAWFASRLEDSNCRIFISEDAAHKPVGQFRASLRSGTDWEIDVSISREYRRNGYGGSLIVLGVHRVFETTACERLHAFVRPDNRGSQLAFEQASFKRLGEEYVDSCRAVHYVYDRTQL